MCNSCVYKNTYSCPYLFKHKDRCESYFGTLTVPTKEKIIELEMIGVCGREEYRKEIENEVNQMSEEQLKERLEYYITLFS